MQVSAQVKQIVGPQFASRKGYIPAQTLNCLVARGPSAAVRNCLKEWGFGDGSPTCSVVVRLDPVKGTVIGKHHFFSVLCFTALLERVSIHSLTFTSFPPWIIPSASGVQF